MKNFISLFVYRFSFKHKWICVYMCVLLGCFFLINELFRIICKVFQLRLITVSDNNKLKVEKEVGKFLLGPFWEQIGSVTGISAKHFRVNVLFSGNCSWLCYMEIKWAMHDKRFYQHKLWLRQQYFYNKNGPREHAQTADLGQLLLRGNCWYVFFLF